MDKLFGWALAASGWVTALVAIIFWGGRLKETVDKHDKVIFPESPGNELVTVSVCNKCQTDCKNSVLSQIDKITDHMETNSAILTKIQVDISGITGYIQGTMERQSTIK